LIGGRESIERQFIGLRAKGVILAQAGIQEFDAAAQAGRIPESDGFEDFFAVDHLEADRTKLVEALQSLA
jgi:hypothetical protein